MSRKSQIVDRFSLGRRSLMVAALATISLGVTVAVMAQEPEHKTFSEHLKDYWGKLVAKMESSSKAAGEEYHKLKDQAAKASGPAREKLSAQMEHLGKKWAVAREKLATTLELRMHGLGDEVKELQEKAGTATGPAREKMAAEAHKLHEEWTAARAKLEATLSTNLKSSRDQIEHLKEHASGAAADAKAKLGPRMDRLKAEYHKDREKLTAYLEADLKQTEEDMKKLGEASSNAARNAKEKLMKKYHELKAKAEDLAKEKGPED